MQPHLNSFQLGDYVVTAQLLGKGSYGEVYLGHSETTKERLAVKVIKVKQSKTPLKILKAEVFLLQRVQSHHIVKFYDVKKNNDGDHFIFLQYCDSDLKKEIQKKSSDGEYSSEKDVMEIFKQICNGYKVLYQNKIIHRDIKPENILMHDGVYKIADFGFGRIVDSLDDISIKTILGSPIYTAPQILERQGYSAKCDIWSLGVLLYQLLFFETPFNMKTVQQLRHTIPKKKISIPSDPPRSQTLRHLLLRMLCIEEKQRIDWPELFTHDLLKEHEQLDAEHMNAIHTVQKVLKFYQQVCVFVSKITNYFSYFESQLPQKVYLIGLLALTSYTLYLCRSTIQHFFSKHFPHQFVDNESWNLYKETNNYWELLKQLKANLVQLEQFVQRLLPNVLSEINYVSKQLKSAVQKLIDKNTFNIQRYDEVMAWVLTQMKANGLPQVMAKYMDVCKNPFINFQIETNFQQVYEAVQRDFKVLESSWQ